MSGSTRVYAGVGLDNSNVTPSPVNSASTAVANNANANGWRGGFNGAYFAAMKAPGTATKALKTW